MEKYEKPVMEVEKVENDTILTSVTECTGLLSYGGSCSYTPQPGCR